MKHRLKTWPVLFADIEYGVKTFEIRKNDRNFKVGDYLILEEFEPTTQKYSGNSITVKITYTISLNGLPDFPDNFIGMSIEHIPVIS